MNLSNEQVSTDEHKTTNIIQDMWCYFMCQIRRFVNKISNGIQARRGNEKKNFLIEIFLSGIGIIFDMKRGRIWQT